MAGISRRKLLGGAAGVAAGSAALSVLPPSLRRAVADPVRKPGPLKNIEHVVILMQENRSFDHYFGTLPGVRGFSDPDAITLPTGRSVFHQPYPEHPDGYLLPFHLDTKTSSAQAMPATSHSWRSQHESWNNGAMDGFVTRHVQVNGPETGPYTMGYYERDDIPLQFAVAQSFTVCDAYHCSTMASTTPNRLYLLSASLDPEGRAGGPITSNAIPDGGYRWTSYPERLSEAGVSWQIYQQQNGKGYNPLEHFPTYAASKPGEALYEGALTIGPSDQFEYDVAHDRLPTVSWVLPTNQQSEHPDFFPAAGADFVASKLEAVAANPDVWAKTVIIVNYDENDGLFDHVPPPTPTPGTPDEFIDGEPIGAGFRVPCMIVSPWTVGGYVAPEPFDHTSVLQFLERITGVRETNITDWRRSTFGDLTSALGFSSSRPAPKLPPTKPHLWQAVREVATLPPAPIPGDDQTPPEQKSRRDTSTVAVRDDLPDKLPGRQPYYEQSLTQLLQENPGDPEGYADMPFPRQAMREVEAEFTPEPGVRYAYVPAGTLRIVDTRTAEAVKAIKAGSYPFGVAATPDGTKVYTANSGSSSLAVIDTATATVSANITVGLFPHGVSISPDGRYVYVANTGPGTDGGRGPAARTISVIDTASDTVAGEARVGPSPLRIAFHPDGERAYVTCDDALWVLTVGRHPHRVRRIPVRGRAGGVDVTPDGSEVWMVNARSDEVAVLDARSLRTKTTVEVGRNPCNVAFAGGYGYVTNANADTLSVIAVGSHTVAGTIDVGHIPVDLSTAIDGQAWVTTNMAGQTLQTVDLESGKVLHTLNGRYGIAGIAII